MGLLDDAIREHLDLKRQHGAGEDELARQEAEALGPVTDEDLAAGGGATGGESDVDPEGGLPFDRVAESELDEESAEPSIEWTGTDPDDIDVPSFVPAEPASDGPADDLEPLEEPWSDLGRGKEANAADADLEGGPPDAGEPDALSEAAPLSGEDPSADVEEDEPLEDEVPALEPEGATRPEPEPFEAGSPPFEVSPAELAEPDAEPFEPEPEPEPERTFGELSEAPPVPDDLPQTEAFQAVDLEALRREPPAEREESAPGPGEPEAGALSSELEPELLEPEPLEPEPEPLEPEPPVEPHAATDPGLSSPTPQDASRDLEPSPEEAPPLESHPLHAEDPPRLEEAGEPPLEADEPPEPPADLEPALGDEPPLGLDPAAEQGDPPAPGADGGPITQVWSVVDEPGLAAVPPADDPDLASLEQEARLEREPVAEESDRDPDPIVDDPEVQPEPLEGEAGFDAAVESEPIEERPVFEPLADAEEGPPEPLAPPSQAPSVPDALEPGVEPDAEEPPPREPPVAARGFFEETEEHETLWHEERPDPDFEN
jgi:hypothetical protein